MPLRNEKFYPYLLKADINAVPAVFIILMLSKKVVFINRSYLKDLDGAVAAATIE